jgi:hypothetical protein
MLGFYVSAGLAPIPTNRLKGRIQIHPSFAQHRDVPTIGKRAVRGFQFSDTIMQQHQDG